MLSLIRYRLLRILFVGECCLFVWFYVHGGHGMQELWRMQKENNTVLQEKNEVALHVTKLETDLASWDQKTLVKERIARETLHMARPSDTVYYWS
jgi:cell division protein FtsB